MIAYLYAAILAAFAAAVVFWAVEWYLARRDLRRLAERIDREWREAMQKAGWPHEP